MIWFYESVRRGLGVRMFGNKLGEASRALVQYRREIQSAPEGDREVLEAHARAAERVISSVGSKHLDEAKRRNHAFKWQVSDSFAKQPPAYKGLSRALEALLKG